MKIGLALGGGAARGYAHIGVIETLLDAGVEIHCVAGTSMGALVGAGFCSGNFKEFSETVKKITLPEIPSLLSPTLSRKGFFSGRNIVELIDSTLKFKNVEDLPTPFAAVAVDLLQGQPVSIMDGALADALRCSISIPIVFTPVEFRGSLYVDGGIVDPVPVEAAKMLGADVVIAVDLFGDIGDPAQNREARKRYREEAGEAELGLAAHYLRKFIARFDRGAQEGTGEVAGLLEVMERTLAVAQFHATQSRFQRYPADVVLSPSLGHIGLFDFHRAEDISEVGAQCAKSEIARVLDSLKQAKA
jgi:NTE family protein